MILKFTTKIFFKEWRKLSLPFLSVLLTGAVVTTSFFLIDSAKNFITEKNKEILGGDIVFEASSQINLYNFISPDNIAKESSQITFSGLLSSSQSGEEKFSGANFKFVDENYPLYGELKLADNEKYFFPKADEVYIDTSLAKNLGLDKGGELLFNGSTFRVVGVVQEDPESLVPSFNISGKIYLAREALDYAKVDLAIFRKEYEEKVILKEKISPVQLQTIRDSAKNFSVRVRADGSGQNGLMFGLGVVEKFLIVTILIISLLSLVNIYASVNYLANRLRRSFAILISLGMNMKNVYKILLLLNLFIIAIGAVLGMLGGAVLSRLIADYVNQNFAVNLTVTPHILDLALILGAITLTSIFATFPVLNRLRNISPKELLTHGEKTEQKRTLKSVLFDTLIGVLPITFLAIYFLESWLYGSLTIVSIVFVYAGLMIFYFYFVEVVYKNRNIFSFPLKMITTQKKFDGFFGLITFASLFIALASIYNLSIVRTSVDEYLKKDLSQNLPSTYLLDVQASQEPKLKESYPELTLFPNVRARIVKIDSLDIQKALSENQEGVDRELGREFNLTYRNYLLSSEKIIDIKPGKTFESIAPGEVSVEKDFAERAGIKLGSQVEFLIQGINISATVTSIREVDTRSGYPFFFMVFSEEELSAFPKTFFGYLNLDESRQSIFKNILAKDFPNVSVIDTGNIAKIAEDLINALLLIILIITLPPLLLSAMLIVTILASVAKERKRDGARLMALGKTANFIRGYYIIESISTTVLASGFAYIFALLVANFVVMKYLEIDNITLFDNVSFYIFIFILLGIILVSIFLWNSGKKSLREYLNYEENN